MREVADSESTLDLCAHVECAPFDTLLFPTTLNGRYEVSELLGKGGMGVVYRATDLVSGRALALKTLRSQNVSPTSLALFKAEFMTLATLSHPNVAAVYDFARRHGSAEYFFTMELVTGQGALSATRGASFEQIWGLISQILRALSYLHARGVIHFDVKPANIMVTSEGRVRLLDFGVARSTYSSEHGLYATPVYTAPEVRNEGAEVDRRADLYSLGVTWFQLLFRRLPVAHAALERSDGGAFELSAAERAQVPPWMPTLLQRLLASDPARRYRTANEVMAAVNRACGAAEAIETDETSDSYVASAALVGRERAFQELHGHVQRRVRLGQREPLAALCVGPSGSGKSRLLRELRHRFQLARYFVLEGKCYAEASEPYGAWSEVVAQAASALGPAASAHLPVVERLAWPVAARLGLTGERRALSVDALADGVVQLLLASSAPCVVILGDLQWMDAMSLELLELVLERCADLQRERPVYLAFLISSRQECASSLRAALSRWRNARALLEVALAPLDVREVGELIGAMLGTSDIAPPLVQALTEATGGDALLVAELLRAWVKAGRLRPQAAGWTFRVAPGSPEIALEIERLFRDRLKELAPMALQALSVLAIFGRPLPYRLLSAVLSAVLEARSDSTLEAVAELRRRNLVFLSRDELVHVSTDRWTDAAHALIEPEQRTALHLRLGDALAASGDAALAALHYQRGANLAAAVNQYGRAAEQCYERGALSEVLEHAERAAACGASGAALGRLCSVAAEAARQCGDRRAVTFAERALGLSPAGSSDWLQASRVAIATFNPFAKGS